MKLQSLTDRWECP